LFVMLQDIDCMVVCALAVTMCMAVMHCGTPCLGGMDRGRLL
jgi:hypothetical protein